MWMDAVQDEYLAIIDMFGNQKPYVNNVSAEETHLAFLKEVCVSYGLDFPADDSADHIVIPTCLKSPKRVLKPKLTILRCMNCS
jgi:hypothetical protein